MRYGIRWCFQVAMMPPSGQVDGELESHLDRVMEELLKLETSNETVADPSVGANFDTGEVEIDLLVEAASVPDALMVGLIYIRTAVHAAGGHTGSWDIGRDQGGGMVEYGLVNVNAELLPA